MRSLATAVLVLISCALQVQAQQPLVLYGIGPGAKLDEISSKYGKPNMRMPFEDGWVAYVYQFQEHNLIVETANDDANCIIAVQIQGRSNPPSLGLLGIDLGSTTYAALKILGAPLERRASQDEFNEAMIPGAFIYQYDAFSFEDTNGKVTSIKLHFSACSAHATLSGI